MAPVNTKDKEYSLLLLQSKEILEFNADSTAVIGLTEGSSVVRVLHTKTGIRQTKTINVSEPVSTAKIEKLDHDIKILPNPAENYIKVRLPVQANINATIFSSNGVAVEEFSNQGDFSVNLEKYQSGVYFIRIEYFNETEVIKFIKK